MKNSSRRVRIEIHDTLARDYSLGGIELLSMEEPGSRECNFMLPVLNEPHVIIVPKSERFLSNSEIYLEGFRYQGNLIDNSFILGFRDLGLRLTLDIPHGRDVKSKDIVMLQQ